MIGIGIYGAQHYRNRYFSYYFYFSYNFLKLFGSLLCMLNLLS